MEIKVQEKPFFNPSSTLIDLSNILELDYSNFDDLRDTISGVVIRDYDKWYDTLKSFTAVLDSDPTEVGINTLNAKMALVQSHKDELIKIVIDAQKDLVKWENLAFYVTKFYRYNRNKLLSEDWVKELKNQELREAAVVRKIPDIVNIREYCDRYIQVIKTFLKQCDVVYNNLKSINDNISRQITVIQQQIEIGEIRRKY